MGLKYDNVGNQIGRPHLLWGGADAEIGSGRKSSRRRTTIIEF